MCGGDVDAHNRSSISGSTRGYVNTVGGGSTPFVCVRQRPRSKNWCPCPRPLLPPI